MITHLASDYALDLVSQVENVVRASSSAHTCAKASNCGHRQLPASEIAGKLSASVLKAVMTLRSCTSAAQKQDGELFHDNTCRSKNLWISQSSGPSSNWHTVQIDLDGTSDFKLILEGTIPEGNPDAKICVDNITSYAQPCTELAASTSPSSFSWLEHMILIFAGALALGLIIPITLLLVRVHRRKRRGKKMSRLSCVVVTGGDVVVPPQRDGSNALPNGRDARNGVDAAGRLPAVSAGRSNAGAATAAANAAAAARRAPPPPPATAPPMEDDRSQPPSYPGSLERPPPRYEEAMGLLDDKVPTAEL